jgi:hypothetical protein
MIVILIKLSCLAAELIYCAISFLGRFAAECSIMMLQDINGIPTLCQNVLWWVNGFSATLRPSWCVSPVNANHVLGLELLFVQVWTVVYLCFIISRWTGFESSRKLSFFSFVVIFLFYLVNLKCVTLRHKQLPLKTKFYEKNETVIPFEVESICLDTANYKICRSGEGLRKTCQEFFFEYKCRSPRLWLSFFTGTTLS